MPRAKKPAARAGKKALAKTNGLPISMEEMEQFSGQGFEDADKDAFAIPFIRILQGQSPQIDKNEESYIKGAEQGMFFNTVTNELYGTELKVIPVHYGRDFIEWLPNRGGFAAAHGPDPTVLDRVREVNEKNESILDNGNIISDHRNHFILLVGKLDQGPIIFSLTGSGIKHSRKWMSLMNNLLIPKSSKKAPMFAGVWVMKTVLNTNDDGKWYMVGNRSSTAISFDRWVSKEELDAALQARELVTSGRAKADYDSLKEKSQDNDDVPF